MSDSLLRRWEFRQKY